MELSLKFMEEKMAFNMKKFREESLKITQREFADLIGERQDRISRLENGDPDDIPRGIMIKIAERTGQTLDQLEKYEKPMPKALCVMDTWKDVKLFREILKKYRDGQSMNAWKPYEKSIEFLTEYECIIKTNFRKPRVVFVGQSDVGKSTVINSLIGAEKMPSAWQPTTSILIYIKHIDDRHEWITDEALVFRGEDDKLFTSRAWKMRKPASAC